MKLDAALQCDRTGKKTPVVQNDAAPAVFRADVDGGLYRGGVFHGTVPDGSKVAHVIVTRPHRRRERDNCAEKKTSISHGADYTKRSSENASFLQSVVHPICEIWYNARMETILYFRAQTNSRAESKLAGVMDIAKKCGWHVQIVDASPTPDRIVKLREYWSPCGAIVECGTRAGDVDVKTFGSLPVVYLDRDPDSLPKSAFCVFNDADEAVRLASKELLMTGHPSFAYVPSPGGHFWSTRREESLIRTLQLHGKACHVFSCGAAMSDSPRYHRDLQKFLATLPKPCALLAANDLTAADAIVTAARIGISIPYELAIVGIDNIKTICEHTSPTLSSVEPDFRRGGELAAILLKTVLRYGRRFRGRRKITFGYLRLVRRASTRILKNHDKEVSAAIELIAHEVCAGIGVKQVMQCFNCSRRMAELRFRRATGHTIMDEIHAVRLDQAKRKLSESNCILKAISDFCGFKNPNSLRKFFRKSTGMTMSEWRQTHVTHA